MSRSEEEIAKLKHILEETLEPWQHMLIAPGRLTEVKPIAAGGYGIVSQASLKDTKRFRRGKKVAVKKLVQTGEDKERLNLTVGFARELKVWARAKHPNILPLIGFFLDTDAAEALFVSPYEPHGNINTYLRKERPDGTKRLQLAIDTAEGLAYLHTTEPNAICHGDIKSENVVINSERRAMLCDFGLAKVVEEHPSGLTTARFAGARTLRYQSPELFINAGARRNLKSDVWAWGGLLLEILTDELPFHRCNGDLHIMNELGKSNPPASVGDLPIPESLQNLLGQCWDTEPDSRPGMPKCLEDLKGHVDEAEGGACRLQ